MSDAIMRMVPVVIFFVVLMGMGFWIQKRSADAAAKDFFK